MHLRTIHNVANDLQYKAVKNIAKDRMMTVKTIWEAQSRISEKALYASVQQLIADNAKEVDGTYVCTVDDLSPIDQKHLLNAYLCWAEGEYGIEICEDINKKPILFYSYLEDYKKRINRYLENYCDDVYCDHQWESGFRSHKDSQTGERLWRR